MCSITTNVFDRLGENTLSRLQKIAPAMLTKSGTLPSQSFTTGVTSFDGLFPNNAIPFGHLFELTGGASGGKTALAHYLLAKLPVSIPAAYVDACGMFFPCAAAVSGVATGRLQVVRTASAGEAVSATEQLLRLHSSRLVVCDLTDCRDMLRTEWIHRLRMNTLKVNGLVFILTDTGSGILPPSTMSAQLTVTRCGDSKIVVAVTKSRIMRVGMSAEVYLQ